MKTPVSLLIFCPKACLTVNNNYNKCGRIAETELAEAIFGK